MYFSNEFYYYGNSIKICTYVRDESVEGGFGIVYFFEVFLLKVLNLVGEKSDGMANAAEFRRLLYAIACCVAEHCRREVSGAHMQQFHSVLSEVIDSR